MLCWGVIKVMGANAALQETFLLSLAPHQSMLEGSDPKAMLGVIEVLGGECCFAANSFYCLRLPIHPMLGGGDPNAMLGGHKSPWG